MWLNKLLLSFLVLGQCLQESNGSHIPLPTTRHSTRSTRQTTPIYSHPRTLKTSPLTTLKWTRYKRSSRATSLKSTRHTTLRSTRATTLRSTQFRNAKWTRRLTRRTARLRSTLRSTRKPTSSFSRATPPKSTRRPTPRFTRSTTLKSTRNPVPRSTHATPLKSTRKPTPRSSRETTLRSTQASTLKSHKQPSPRSTPETTLKSTRASTLKSTKQSPPRSSRATPLKTTKQPRTTILRSTKRVTPKSTLEPSIQPTGTVSSRSTKPKRPNKSTSPTKRLTTSYAENKKQLADKTTKTPNGRNERRSPQVDAEIRSHPVFNVSVQEGLQNLRSTLNDLNSTDGNIISGFVQNASVLLAKTQMENEEDLDSKSEHDEGIEIIQTLEKLGEQVSGLLERELEKGDEDRADIQIWSYYLVFGVAVAKPVSFEGYTFPNTTQINNQSYGVEGNSINLPTNIFKYTNLTQQNYSRIISLAYNPTKQMLNATSRGRKVGGGKIISTSIHPPIVQALSGNDQIIITLETMDEQSNAECVYWNYTTNNHKGGWSNFGCQLDPDSSNETHAVCVCNHLTDFSVLIDVAGNDLDERNKLALEMITKIGCSISIFFLFVTMAIILLFRNIRKQFRYRIHFHLSLALSLANIAFLLNEVALANHEGCLVVSIVTFYFYMAAFFWMLCEGIFIWRALVSVFTEKDRFAAYMLIGWGTPCIIVTITTAIKYDNMTSENFCWLPLEDGVLMSFVVPAIVVIFANLIILSVTLKIAGKHAEKMDQSSTLAMARMTLLLLPIFGATWLFGVLAINNETLFFKYIFTILNTLQGLFIFMVYIVLSKETRLEIKKRLSNPYALALFHRCS
eukprot:TCONS_00072929-protein